jgi:hypothetical protein
MPYTYQPGGTRLGDRIMALRPFMLEKGGQKYWNEIFAAVSQAVPTGVTLPGGATTLGEINLATFVPPIQQNWMDPMVGRQMPGYSFPTTQVFIFQGFRP